MTAERICVRKIDTIYKDSWMRLVVCRCKLGIILSDSTNSPIKVDIIKLIVSYNFLHSIWISIQSIHSRYQDDILNTSIMQYWSLKDAIRVLVMLFEPETNISERISS